MSDKDEDRNKDKDVQDVHEESTMSVPAYDSWSTQGERLKLEDPLLECLVILAGENGRQTSIAALTSGLPLSKEGFASPALFARAAERVNMSPRLIKRPLEDILSSPSLPCILVLKDNQACILRSVKGPIAKVTYPERPNDITKIKVSELEERFYGYAFFLSNALKMDDRLGPMKSLRGKSWFWDIILHHKPIYLQVAFTTLIINILALVGPIYIMNIYDRVLPNNAFDTLMALSVGTVLAMLFDFVLKNLRAHFLDAAGRKADIRISSRIYEHILNMKMEKRPASSGVLADNVREFETLRDFFTSATVTTLIDMPFALFFIALIYVIGGSIAVVPFVILIMIVGFGLILQKPMGKGVEENMRESAYKSSILIETLNGLESIKSQAAESHTQRKWEEIIEKSSETSLKTRFIASLGVNFTALMAGLSSVFIAFYGVYLAAAGALSAGALIAAVILSGRVIAPLAQFATVLTRFNQSRMALKRLNDLMELPLERESQKTYTSKPVLEGEITFKNVSFAYPNTSQNILNRCSLKIEAGDNVGIIGAVGCGKTTLHRLLMNLYEPSEGSVQIDGLDVRKIEPGDLRRNIGIAQQDAYMFYGSIRDNITMGHEAVSEAAIVKAAELAGVTKFTAGSSLGLDTPVGERGSYLSGGQRQAIAIARALLYDPPILILDEPTASIDPKSEKVLYERLQEIRKDKTVILITHKTVLLGLVDKLVLMDQGHIIDYGSRDEIIEKLQKSHYTQAPAGGKS